MKLKYKCDTCDKKKYIDNLIDDTIFEIEEYICEPCESKGLGNRNLARKIYKCNFKRGGFPYSK